MNLFYLGFKIYFASHSYAPDNTVKTPWTINAPKQTYCTLFEMMEQPVTTPVHFPADPKLTSFKYYSSTIIVLNNLFAVDVNAFWLINYGNQLTEWLVFIDVVLHGKVPFSFVNSRNPTTTFISILCFPLTSL